MKPVAIFRFSATEGPGHFATFLDSRSIEWQVYAIDQGDDVPKSALNFSGIAMMGGPMSVNDELPWISQMADLTRDAIACDVPVIGHCLGGQMLAKAMGAPVSVAPEPEIGWGEVLLTANPLARTWFGDAGSFLSFHWHKETFAIPAGATLLASSGYCANQAYAFGKHIGMQCHIEMTRAMVETWLDLGARDFERWRGPGVQSPQDIVSNLDARLTALSNTADKVYSHWVSGLATR